jgi:hypothetical protein
MLKLVSNHKNERMKIGIDIKAEAYGEQGAQFTVNIRNDEGINLTREDAIVIVEAINDTINKRFAERYGEGETVSQEFKEIFDERKATSEAEIDERPMEDYSPKQKDDSSEGGKFSSKPDGLSEEEIAAEIDADIDVLMNTIEVVAGNNSKADKKKATNEFLKLLAKVGQLTPKEFYLFCKINDFPSMEEAGAAFDALLATSRNCRCEKGIYPVDEKNCCGGCEKQMK